MRKLFCLAFAVILFAALTGELRAAGLKVGTRFPVENLPKAQKTGDTTIVAFLPTLTYDCEYASMLTQSFYYYFDRQMAFEGLKKSPATRIFLVVRDKPDPVRSAQNIFGEMTIVYDETGEHFSEFGVRRPAGKNADSTVVLLDSNDIIAHLDENYRAQGEHLKPLENKLRELNGIYRKPFVEPSPKALRVGDKAPDFRVNEKEMLSDLRGRVVLVSFYPAAFSGTLPKPFEITAADLKYLQVPAYDPKSISCVFQIDSLDVKKKPEPEAKRIVVSSSTGALLDEWRKTLATENIEYANDADYSVSLKYASYNPNGYNNRVSVIVDKKGRIAYIDRDFDFNDEAALNAKIAELSKK